MAFGIGSGNDLVATVKLILIDELGPGLAKASGEFAAAGKAADSTSAGFLNAGKAATALSFGVAGAGIAVGAFALKSAADFNESLQTIQGNTAMTNQEIEFVRQSVLKLGADSPQALSDVSQGFEKAADLGFHYADGMQLVSAANLAAVATGGKTADIVNAVGTAMYNFHEPASRATADTSILLKAASEANTRLPELSTNFSRVGQFAAAMHVPLADAAAIYAVLTKATGDAGRAQTEEVGLLTHVISPTKQATDLMAALAKTTGIDLVAAFKQASEGGLSMHDLLEKVKEATKGNVQEINTLFGGIRGGAGALTLINTHWEDYNRIQRDLHDPMVTNGQLLHDLAAKMENELGPQLKTMENRVTELSISLGTKLMPAANDFLDWVQHIEEHMPQATKSWNDAGQSALNLGSHIDTAVGKKGSTGSGLAGLADWLESINAKDFELQMSLAVKAIDGVKGAATELSTDLELLQRGLGINVPSAIGNLVSAASDGVGALKHLGGGDAGGIEWTQVKFNQFGDSVQNTLDQMHNKYPVIAATTDAVKQQGDAVGATTAKWENYATTLDSKVTHALQTLTLDQLNHTGNLTKDWAAVHSLSAEYITYTDQLQKNRDAVGLDTTATQRLNAGLDATGKSAGFAGSQIVILTQAMKDFLATVPTDDRGTLLGLVHGSSGLPQSSLASPGEIGSLVHGSGFGNMPGTADLTPPGKPDPKQLAAARILAGTGTDADYNLLGLTSPAQLAANIAAGGSGENARQANQGTGATPGYTPPPFGATFDAAGSPLYGSTPASAGITSAIAARHSPGIGGAGGDTDQQVTTILGQIAAEQLKVDSGSLKLTADNSALAAQSLQAQAQGIADLTSVMAAQSNVLSVDAQGTIQSINDQSAIAKASYALTQANTPQARAAAQEQLTIARQEADYHRQEASVNHKIAEAQVKAAQDKLAWDKTIAADQAKVAADQLQVDTDSQKIELDTLKVLTDGFTKQFGSSVGTDLLGPDEKALKRDQGILSTDQGTLSSDQGLAAVNAAQDAQGIEVLREALARIMEQAGISGANGQQTMEQLTEAVQQSVTAQNANTQAVNNAAAQDLQKTQILSTVGSQMAYYARAVAALAGIPQTSGNPATTNTVRASIAGGR